MGRAQQMERVAESIRIGQRKARRLGRADREYSLGTNGAI
jgi:hypothetical protein